MSRKRKLAMAATILGAGLLANRTRPMVGSGAPPTAKTPSSSKKISRTRTVDLGDESKNLVGKTTKITVDKDALPREIKEKADKVKAKKKEQLKVVKKRRDEGKLSPVMPKSESQFDAMQSPGLGAFDGAKRGKMIRARGGGMAIQGMKPTKLY